MRPGERRAGPPQRVVGAAGATPVGVPLLPERGFHIDLEALATAVTPRTRAILINSPHNPSGSTASLETIEIRYAYVPTPIIKHVEGKGVVYDELPEPQTGSTTVNA